MRRFIPYFACIALVFSVCTAFAQYSNRPGGDEQSAANAQQEQTTNKPSSFDRQFVQKAAEGNQAEIELAQLAQQKASSPEVKDLAQTIEQDHQKAQGQLQQIAQSQNLTMPTEGSKEASKEKQKLSAMSGDQFDQAYVQYMIKEHKKDISEFQKATKRATDSSVRQYATTTLPDLQKHLEMAQKVAGQESSSQAHE